jgi:drug/metabolite transporter (DMT)-like permease
MAIPTPGLRYVPLKSVLYMLGGVFFLAVMDASAKWLTSGYSVVQLIFIGRLPAPVFAAVFALASGGLGTLKTTRIGWHLLRAIFGALTMGTFFYALKLLPLADTVTIAFVGPLFMCALSVPLLGEKVEPRRWIAILVGLAGVVVILQPSGAGFGLGPVLALTAAFTYAVSVNISRRISDTETSHSMLFWFSMFLIISSGSFAPLEWVTPHGSDLAVFVVLACGGTVGQFLLTQAFRYGEISFLAPLEYTALIWATLFGFLFWQQFPTPTVLAGAAIIVACNLYVVHREARAHNRRLDQAIPAPHVPET